MYIPFALSAYENNEYSLPPVVLENWYAEEAPDNMQRPARLIPCPGLVQVEATTNGDLYWNAAGALFQGDGILDGDIIAVNMGLGTVWRLDPSSPVWTEIDGVTFLVSQTALPQFAGTQADLVVLSGVGVVHTVEAGDVQDFTWAGKSGSINAIATAGQRILYAESGSGRVWISDAGDPTTVTDFVTAESSPDNAVALAVLVDDIYIFGSRTIEVAYVTGDIDTPVAFRPGATYGRGIRGSRAVASNGSVLAFVGDDNDIYLMAGGQLRSIGTRPLATLLTDVEFPNLIAMRFYSEGQREFFILSIPEQGDWFYDIRLGLWHRRLKLSSVFSGIGPCVRVGAVNYTLDNTLAKTKLLRMDSTVFTNDGEAVRRVATALYPIEDGETRIRHLVVEGQAGIGLEGEVQGSDPQLFLRIAHNGRTFGSEISRSMGGHGDYARRIVYGPLGVARPPVVCVEIAYSDPVGFTVTGAKINPQVTR